MARLPAEWRDRLPTLASLRLGSCDRSGQPRVCRALAAEERPDGRMLVLLTETAAPQLVAAVRDSARVALLATSPRTNQTLHLKGLDACVAPAEAAHAHLLAQRRATLTRELAEVDGFGQAPFLAYWFEVGMPELVAIHFSVSVAWNQTPGPLAGQALVLEPTP